MVYVCIYNSLQINSVCVCILCIQVFGDRCLILSELAFTAISLMKDNCRQRYRISFEQANMLDHGQRCASKEKKMS